MTLVGVEYMFIKYLAVVVWKRLLPILDDFFAVFLLSANISVSFLLALIPPMLSNITFDYLKLVGQYYIPSMTLPLSELQ